MAREIIIYEQREATLAEKGFVKCLFIYHTSFDRGGVKMPLTPLLGLADDLVNLLDTEEQEAIDQGDLSWDISSHIVIPSGADTAARNQRIIHKYNATLANFRRNIEQPKEADVEYLDAP